MNLRDIIGLETLQSVQDELVRKHQVGLLILDHQLIPISQPSYPPYGLFERSIKQTPLSEVLFSVEKSILSISSSINEPLFSSFLTGRIIRATVPIHHEKTLVGFICILKIVSHTFPHHLFARLMFSHGDPGEPSVMEQLMDSHPLVPSIQFWQLVDEITQELVTLIRNSWKSLSTTMLANDEPEVELADSASQLLIFTNAEGEIVHTTKPVITLLGYQDREALKGRSIYEILKLRTIDMAHFGKDAKRLPEMDTCTVAINHSDGRTLYGELHISSYRPGKDEAAPTMFQWKIKPKQAAPEEPAQEPTSSAEDILSPPVKDSTYINKDSFRKPQTVAPTEPHSKTSGLFRKASLGGFAIILEAYPRPLFIIDNNDTVCIWNKRAEQLFHFSAPGIDEINFGDFLQQEAKTVWMRKILPFRSIKHKREASLSHSLSCVNGKGELFSAAFDFYRNDLLGGQYISVTTRELYQPVPGNDYLLTHTESPQTGIILTDSGGSILSTNKSAAAYLQMDEDALREANLSDLLQSKDRHSMNNLFLKMYTKESEELSVTFRSHPVPCGLKVHKLADRSEDEHSLLWTVHPQNEAGQMNHWRTAAGAAITDGSHAVSEMYQVFSQLFEKISFQLFEDLAAIQDEVLVEPNQQALLGRIEVIAEQASNMSEKLGHFCHKKSPVLKPHNLNMLLEDFYKTIRSEFNNPIQLELNNIPAVYVDQEDIWFMMQALIENADEAMTKKGQIRVRTFLKKAPHQEQLFRQADRNNDFVGCSISDSGKGIPSQVRQHLYGLFSSDKNDRIGRGLGLACVMAIITRCNGYIDYETEKGVGTTFYLYFPALPEPASPDICPPVLNPALPTILAVDDENSLLELYKSNLQNQYNVICAANGETAVRLMRENREHIDLCIVDINLPDSNMINCPVELIKIKPSVPFIIATGESNNGSLDNFLCQSRTFWLHKPFPPSQLKRAVERLLKVY